MTNARRWLAHVFLGVAVVAAAVACASGSGSVSSAAQPAAQASGLGSAPARSTPSILIADDLRKSNAQNWRPQNADDALTSDSPKNASASEREQIPRSKPFAA